MTLSTGTILRPAEDADASALAQLIANVSASGQMEVLLTSAAIISAGGLSLVAERDGHLLGHVIVERRQDNLGEVGIHIHESARDVGVGKALMERAIAWSVETGLSGLYLCVSSANVVAAALYSSLGFGQEKVQGNSVTMKLPLP
jgi:N-acetylglutamate synthase-like GNAT family acetyltransferase